MMSADDDVTGDMLILTWKGVVIVCAILALWVVCRRDR